MEWTKEQQKEHRELLCQRLTDGSFIQGVGLLRILGWEPGELDQYCCLGVASDVKREVTGDGGWLGEQFVDSSGASTMEMTPAVKEFFGFAEKDGSYAPDVVDNSLIDQNDSGQSFDRIAETIRREPPGLVR